MQLTRPNIGARLARLREPGALLSQRALLRLAIVVAVLGMSLLFGRFGHILPEQLVILGIAGSLGLAILLSWMWRDMAGFLTALVIFSPFVNRGIGVGTNSYITMTMIAIAVATGLTLVRALPFTEGEWASNPLSVPVIAFLIALGISWIVGYFVLDWRINLPADIILIQGAQVAIYAFSFGAFFVAANATYTRQTLARWIIALALIGAFAFLLQTYRGFTAGRFFGGMGPSTYMWPVVFVGGQLLFNDKMRSGIKMWGWIFLAIWAVWSLTAVWNWKSGWVPAGVAIYMMLWLRDRKAAFLLTIAGLIVLVSLYFSTRYLFASTIAYEGASLERPYIWYDVLRFAARSPVFGIGPATYEFYWRDPTFVSEAVTRFYWANPNNYSPPSHSMLIDVMTQTGIVGTIAFLWLLNAALRLAWRARNWFADGFMRGYTMAVATGFTAMVAVSIGFGDWMLPFVYNINIRGFQHSFYSWLFLGTLVALERGRQLTHAERHE